MLWRSPLGQWRVVRIDTCQMPFGLEILNGNLDYLLFFGGGGGGGGGDITKTAVDIHGGDMSSAPPLSPCIEPCSITCIFH